LGGGGGEVKRRLSAAICCTGEPKGNRVRPMNMTWRCTLVLAVAALAGTSCTGTSPAPQTVPTQTGEVVAPDEPTRRTIIEWHGGPSYERGRAAVEACAIKGTHAAGSMDSYPPKVVFLSPNENRRRAFESCALAVPGTGLYVPG
jgi:hypothetical protein